jgi:hypothetical protein
MLFARKPRNTKLVVGLLAPALYISIAIVFSHHIYLTPIGIAALNTTVPIIKTHTVTTTIDTTETTAVVTETTYITGTVYTTIYTPNELAKHVFSVGLMFFLLMVVVLIAYIFLRFIRGYARWL